MRNFKRFLTLALAVVMLVSAFAMGTSAAKFTDVDEENETLVKAVDLLSSIGVTKGTSDTTFGTEQPVTREQMAAFIYRLMKKGQSIEGGANTSAFTDLEDPTFFFMVSWANTQGIIKGTSATTFNPKGGIKLQDAYTMLVRALGYENEDTLPYPFGYIEVAESKNVALNKGLNSEISYEDTLTRGDVAILLYNTFFAETGIAKTETKETLIGKGSDEGEPTWVLETVTTYPIFCVEYFDVIEVEYQVVATPNYVLKPDASETTEGLGYEAIEVVEVEVDDEKTDAPDQGYIAFEDLGLEGEADDYIMSHIKMYVILDDEEIEEVLYAEPLMVKKNVTEMNLGRVKGSTKNDYFDTDLTEKLLSGEVTIDGKAAYFFNAPYSYITPKYTKKDDAQRYVERNENNLLPIAFDVVDVDEGEYSITVGNFDFDGWDADGDYLKTNAEKLAETLPAVYAGGLYEADLYDVDGDGIYDYINYMPYTAKFVDTNAKETFYKGRTHKDADTVYTGEAVLLSDVEFEDGDYVIGYFNSDANMIKAAAVVEPVEGVITNIKASDGDITLEDGTKISVKDSWKMVGLEGTVLGNVEFVVDEYEWDNTVLNPLAGLLSPSNYDKEGTFYIYNGVLLYQDGIDSYVTYDSNLIIITEDDDVVVGAGEDETIAYFDNSFNAGTRNYYVHAWIDGETKWVAIDAEAEVYPEITKDPSVYLNELATYSVDEDGLYTIKLLNGVEDEDGNTLDGDGVPYGIPTIDELADLEEAGERDGLKSEKEGVQAYFATTENAKLVRNSTRFTLEDTTGGNLLGSMQLLFNDATRVIIKNTYDDGGETVVEFKELTSADIKETIESELENVKLVVTNNPDNKTREYLVLLYAEVTGEELELGTKTSSTKSERIVKSSEVIRNTDGKYYIAYSLFNPYTGKIDTEVPGTKTYKDSNIAAVYAAGDLVNVSSDNTLDEGKPATVKIGSFTTDLANKDNMFLVTNYLESEGVIEVIEIPNVKLTATDWEKTMEDFEVAVDESYTYRIDVSDAKVAVMGGQSKRANSELLSGSFVAGDITRLDGSDTSYLAVNKTAVRDNDEDADIETVYGNYVKVYLGGAEWEDEDDHTIEDKNQNNATANFIVVVANAYEDLALCDLN